MLHLLLTCLASCPLVCLPCRSHSCWAIDCALWLLQVSTPADYTGPVNVTYAAPASGAVSVGFTITPVLIVKVTASELDSP